MGPEDSKMKPLHLVTFPLQVPEPLGEDKKKGKPEKLKRCIRTAAGSSWEDPSLLEWDAGKWAQVLGQELLNQGQGKPSSLGQSQRR